MSEYLLALVEIAVISAVTCGLVTLLIFRKDLFAAWREYRQKSAP